MAAINYSSFEPGKIFDEIKKDAKELKEKGTEKVTKKVKENLEEYKDKVVKDVKEKVKAPLSE